MQPFTADALAAALAAVLGGPPSASHYMVAFSGGLDSTVLLHALVELQRREPMHLRVRALHVHHGLQCQADEWLTHCATVCAALGVRCEQARVDARAAAGESPEAAARAARYIAFAERLEAGEVLLLAHHADDQLETLLLRLMRGSASRGLAGMPARRALGAGELCRPLLDWPRAALEDYARAHGLAWIEDPSNAVTLADRNHLRHAVVPALQQRWPAVARSAARAAAQLGEDASLLAQLAQLDLGEALGAAELPVAMLRSLSPPRQRNALRHALLARGLPLPPRARLLEAVRQLHEAAVDRRVTVRWEGAELHREGGSVWLLETLPSPPPGRRLLTPQQPLHDACGELALVACTVGETSAEAYLFSAAELAAGLSVGYRQGGERVTMAQQDGSRSLQRLLTTAQVPVWLRARLPLLFVGEALVAIAGLQNTARACPQRPCWQLQWRAARPLAPGLARLRRGHGATQD
jgi:tRNA(Ile)-lysidine synthase